MDDITLAQANAAVAAAIEKAEQIGAKMNIAVVDAAQTSSVSLAWTGRGSARSTSLFARPAPPDSSI